MCVCVLHAFMKGFGIGYMLYKGLGREAEGGRDEGSRESHVAAACSNCVEGEHRLRWWIRWGERFVREWVHC